jgi:hypothetical protein
MRDRLDALYPDPPQDRIDGRPIEMMRETGGDA